MNSIRQVARIVTKSICLFLFLPWLAATCDATSEQMFEVTQPTYSENGFWLRTLVVVRNVGSSGIAMEALLTDDSSVVMTRNGPQNRNLASLLNFKISLGGVDAEAAEPLIGDTLFVVIDLSDAHIPDDLPSFVTTAGVLGATIEAVLENVNRGAGRQRKPPRYLNIWVEGGWQLSARGGLYKISPTEPRKQYP